MINREVVGSELGGDVVCREVGWKVYGERDSREGEGGFSLGVGNAERVG